MNMQKLIYSSFIVLLITISNLYAQVQKARLPRIINVPTKSHIYPNLTSDESYMLFYSNYSNTGNYELKYTKKLGPDLWKEPEYIQYILKPHNDHFASFNVSPNGKYLLFSSYRAKGIGKYDILISERSGDQWSQPTNPGKPLNSPGNEGNPCMSPDGRSIYFMRCNTMDATEKSGCKIYVSHKKSKTMWGEPEELPSYINTGHSTTPRMLSDNQTLIFSSERPGNKGKLDLYMTRLENGIWSQPIPMDIINTVRNDEYVSIPARGDVVYYTDVYKDQFNIAMALLPQELRPKKVLLISGEIKNRNLVEKINIQAYDALTGNLVSGINLGEDENEFEIILPEGHLYDFSIFPLDGKHSYHSEIMDLRNLTSSTRKTLDFTIDDLRIGATYPMGAIQIDTVTNSLSPVSELETRRLMAMMRRNPSMIFEIECYTNKPLEVKQIEHVLEVGDSGFVFDGSSDEMFLDDENENTTIQSPPNPNDGFVDLESDEPTSTDSYTDQTETFDYEPNTMDTSQQALASAFQTRIEEVVVFDPNLETQNKAQIIVDYFIKKGVPSNNLRAVGKGYQMNIDSTDKPYWFNLKLGL